MHSLSKLEVEMHTSASDDGCFWEVYFAGGVCSLDVGKEWAKDMAKCFRCEVESLEIIDEYTLCLQLRKKK